jgi:hypothetical protein
MQTPDPLEVYMRTGFEQLGMTAEEAELAVMRVADAIYRSQIDALIHAHLEGTTPEPDADLSQPPRSA